MCDNEEKENDEQELVQMDNSNHNIQICMNEKSFITQIIYFNEFVAEPMSMLTPQIN